MRRTRPNLLRSFSLLAAVTASLACGSALAQWQWLDSTGRKVFSDTPPPVGVPDKNILKRPNLRAAPAPEAAAPASPETGSAGTPAPNTRDEQLEARKKQAEAEEAAKKKAEADKVAQARAANCERARRAKATLDSGVRIAITNTKGEREVMDDKGRAAEAQRLDDIIRSDCGSAGQ